MNKYFKYINKNKPYGKINREDTPSVYNETIAKTQDQLDEQGNIIQKATLQEITEEEYLALQPKRVEPTAEEIATEQRKAEIKSRLTELSEDIIQNAVGEYVPNINERKVEFIKLHNELRELEGKAPRILK